MTFLHDHRFAIYSLFYLLCIAGTYASRNERNVMLVLPVMQGISDHSDPRLQFWYNRPPVTIVLEDNFHESTTTMSTKKHAMKMNRTTDINQLDVTVTNKPGTHENPYTTIENKPRTEIPSLKYKELNTENSEEQQKNYITTVHPNLFVIAAEPNWKSEIKIQNEHEKLKSKLKSAPKKSTILPTSTQFHYYNNFIPFPSISEPPFALPQSHGKLLENTTMKFQHPTSSSDDPVKIYEMLKKSPLKPFPSFRDDMKPLSPELSYADVLNNISIRKSAVTRDDMISPTPVSPLNSNFTTEMKLPVSSITKTIVTIAENTTVLPITRVIKNPASDTLTDSFKSMLIELGILPDNQRTTTEEDLWRDPASFTINPLSYTNFKKLPESEEVPLIKHDIQSLLNSFGLLPKPKDNNATSQKITRESKDEKMKGIEKRICR